ncbi:MAG: flagellar M-ring protein FliF [Deltaproteobacteria bacterium]|nr:flagellar M-ring protein FliF [Deltaproteobacteria bacterium]
MDIEALIKGLKDRVLAMPVASRFAMLAAVAALGIAGVLVSANDTISADAYLFTGLDASDAGEIVSKLKEQRVPFTLAAGGAAIMVPEARVHELRLELAQAGLPKGGGVGFELFDRPSWGQSDFVQQKNYARALQGELERTIGAMASVMKARVHLVLPERRLFRERDERPSASIVLRLRPGRALGEGHASGILHLVASSVPGLSPDRVTLVDDAGNVLTSRGDGVSGEGLDFRRTLERSLEQKVQAMLDRALGANKSSVKVSADVDFSQIERTEETFDPERTALRSEQANEEKQNRAAPAAMGVAGARANLVATSGGVQAPEAASQPVTTNSQKTTTTRNFEINKVTSRTVLAPARVSRLDAAVLVDGVYGDKGKFSPLPKEEMEALEAVIKRAMGYDEKRGDELALRCVPFYSAPETPSEAPPMLEKVSEQARRWALPASAVLVVLLAFVAMLAALRGRRAAAHLPALLPAGPRPLREIEALTADRVVDGTEQPLASAILGDGSSAANVVRGWLSDGKQKETGR